MVQFTVLSHGRKSLKSYTLFSLFILYVDTKSAKVFLCKQIWSQHQSSDMYTCIIYRPLSFMCEIDCINYVFASINKSKLKICMFGPPVRDRKTRTVNISTVQSTG